MIRVSKLCKRYGSTLALNDLTLAVPDGGIFGLLGPNASGKSTLLKLLMGFTFPDSGQIDLGNLAPSRIGYVPERPHLPARASLYEYLKTVGELGGLSGISLRHSVEHRLKQVGLAEVAHWRMNRCSKGMLQRVVLAQALVTDPPLLLLDEPMGGLDPAWQKNIRDLMRTLADEGRTVLFSTHRLSEVVAICTHVCILNRGKLVTAGTMEDVLRVQTQVTITVDLINEDIRARLTSMFPEVCIQGNRLVLPEQAVRRKPQVLRFLLDANVDVRHLAYGQSTLEDIYLEAIRR